MGLPSSPIKIWGKSVQGFLSYDRKNKQTDRQIENTTLYIDIPVLVFLWKRDEGVESGVQSQVAAGDGEEGGGGGGDE